jgi:hypothetical protein
MTGIDFFVFMISVWLCPYVRVHVISGRARCAVRQVLRAVLCGAAAAADFCGCTAEICAQRASPRTVCFSR